MGLLTNEQEDLAKKKKLRPIIDKTELDNWKWNFSFRFWNQVEYFGLNSSESKWFISFLEKLKELSTEKRQNILENYHFQNNLRYHKINWNQKNIPIQKKELDWIDSDYLNNNDEYEFYQFQISKALGRIVGFWDENLIFNIVLLDPLHNIQPTKSYGYKVDQCDKLKCEYTSLLSDIRSINNIEEIKNLPFFKTNTNVIMHHIDEKTYDRINEILETKDIDSIEEILEYGIEYIDSNS